ncbi:hypothetical protein [Limimaricola cinnabarinus]|uniref:Uncharacterized protein n=1 Tax=Limimaricola cinnabarinus TaxID=1125964 RepID=A0A2G1MDQ9_9RHOB|nr:hypothetical protein [Limimaricola cinnabarinus]PHP26802.1 hypothetical protein CJ301_14480 [Limimaricola cinnabarinus]
MPQTNPPSPIEPLKHDSLMLRKMDTMDGKIDKLMSVRDLLETETDPAGHGMLIRVHTVLKDVQEELQVMQADRAALAKAMGAQQEELKRMQRMLKQMTELMGAEISD